MRLDEIATWTEEDWSKVTGHCRITTMDGRSFEGWVSWAWGPPRETGRISLNLSEDGEADVTGEVHIRLGAVREVEVLT